MKTSRLICLLFLGVILIAVLNFNALAQKGKPQPPPPPQGNPAIAYSAARQNQYDLMVMDADGTNQRTVVSQKFTFNMDADWSPDGKQLVFAREIAGNLRGQTTGLYTVNVDGSNLKRIANSNLHKPAWSPMPLGDGKYKIAFSMRVVNPDGTFNYDDLYLVNPDGTGLTQLTDTPGIREWDVDWSPTGDRLMVQTVEGTLYDLSVDLWVYRVDCSTAAGCSATYDRNLIRVPGSPLDGKDANGRWAKAHDRFIVWANTGLDGSYDLWVIDPEYPAQPYGLTHTPAMSESSPSWSPDDSQIVFVWGPSGGLWVMDDDPATNDAKQIGVPTGFGSFMAPNWRRNP